VYQYKIEHVKRVRSGDTFELIVDLGFGVSTTVLVSLEGVETAEYGTLNRNGRDEGLAAREFTLQWLQREEALPLTLHTTRDRRGDFYGLIFDAQGQSLADALLEVELARPVS